MVFGSKAMKVLYSCRVCVPFFWVCPWCYILSVWDRYYSQFI